MQFRLVLLMICCNCKFSYETYTTKSSYGNISQHSNPFVWTLNLPYLNVNIRFEDTDVNPAFRVITISLRLANASILKCSTTGSLTGCGNCTNAENVLEMNPTLINDKSCEYEILIKPLTKDYDGATLNFVANPNSGLPEYVPQILLVKACNSSIVNGINQPIQVTSSGIAGFNSVGECSCLLSSATLFHKDGSAYKQDVMCNASAKWDGCYDAECWYAPTGVTVSQKNRYVDKPANLACNFTEGYPIAIGSNYMIEGQQVPYNVALKTENYNQSFQCQPDTSFTSQNPKSGISQPGKLIVYFGPKITAYPTTAVIPLGGSGNVSILLRANDKNGNISSKFSGNGRIFNTSPIEVNDTYYNYSYVININSSDEYGTYVFKAHTFDPDATDEVNISIQETDITTQNTETIIIICATIIGAIVILIVVTLLVRRQRNKKSAREERINPIYATSSVDNAAAIKEDRINPLYGTTGDPGPEDVNKEEKLNPLYDVRVGEEPAVSAGKDNPGFSIPNTSDTYAEVIKVKKGKRDIPQTSQPEAMYAEVRKVKGIEDSSLHGNVDKAP